MLQSSALGLEADVVDVFRQESGTSDKNWLGRRRESAASHRESQREQAWHGFVDSSLVSKSWNLNQRVCYTAFLLIGPLFPSFFVSLSLYRRHVLAHDPPRIAPAAPFGKQHFPRLAFDPLPCRQSPVKEIIRHRDWYACLRTRQPTARADSFAQRRRTWSSSVVVLLVTSPPSRPVRRVSR